MAAAEALAWGYMGSLMSRSQPYVSGGVAAAFIFLLIWIIDSSFMTLDLRSSEYDQALTGRGCDTTKARLKLAAGAVARVGIVTASLLITAPFLAQAIFSEDLKNEIERRNTAAVVAQRKTVEVSHLARLHALGREQIALEQQRVDEAAGIGPSGRHGRGPALETIERQLDEKRQEIHEASRAREEAMTEFDALPLDELDRRYGLQLLTPGIQTSTALLDEMMDDPRFRRAELAVRAFLALLFAGLLILKLFQPRSVTIYYSERLQSLYDEYRKGIFDDYLPRAERALEGGSIDPLRFEDWCLDTYPLIRRENERRRRTAAEERMHGDLMLRLSELARIAREDFETSRQRHEHRLAELDELEMLRREADSKMGALAAELEKVEGFHDSMTDRIAHADMDGPTFEKAIAASRRLDERRRALDSELRKATIEEKGLEERAGRARRDADQLERETEACRATVAEYERRIRDERRSHSESIARRRNSNVQSEHAIGTLSASEAL